MHALEEPFFHTLDSLPGHTFVAGRNGLAGGQWGLEQVVRNLDGGSFMVLFFQWACFGAANSGGDLQKIMSYYRCLQVVVRTTTFVLSCTEDLLLQRSHRSPSYVPRMMKLQLLNHHHFIHQGLKAERQIGSF